MTDVRTLPFHDGRSIPQLGYGVWQVEDDVAEDVVGQALKAGYRHIDTATVYGNEKGVGKAIAASGVPREDLFVTTKLWNSDQGYESALEAMDASLERLGLDYVDLYLIHWAVPSKGKYVDSWKALIELQKQGKAKSIGVSNFPKEQLQEIIDATGVVPVIHQIELHPYFQQRELRGIGETRHILTESWSPLGQGGGELEDPVITGIAEKHGVDAGQVILAWHLAKGLVVLTKSETPERIVSNFEAASLQLTDEEIAQIDALDKGEDGRAAADPATADF
ncbi:aldo/keto reductase [Brachybacterium sp. JHP9]|uniref:Aldo/keto reductase n=1 Tax=Brachybacterium equifaecis TaxID=2910770 RepID=A0ABT0R2M4_9MICO|nr:aldo/keto reductase [Brachybacterium equifaecis]MCL6424167.1 aldo/keto reductase [Brachybacterium equifaecis]